MNLALQVACNPSGRARLLPSHPPASSPHSTRQDRDTRAPVRQEPLPPALERIAICGWHLFGRTDIATCTFQLTAYRQVKIIGVTKDCDCVVIPQLPIKLIPGSLYELPIAVNLGHDWNGVESTRQLRVFTDPPSGEPIFLKIHVREHR